MSDTTLEAELAGLAERINEEHRLCAAAVRAGLEHAREAGQLLLQAKALVPHGAWGQWLEQHCDVSERTAQLYMQVARDWPTLEAKAQRVADLPLRKAALLLAEPMTELERARRFSEWADGILAEAGPQLRLCALALENAETVEDCQAIIEVTSLWQKRGAEVKLRAERELGRLGQQGTP